MTYSFYKWKFVSLNSLHPFCPIICFSECENLTLVTYKFYTNNWYNSLKLTFVRYSKKLYSEIVNFYKTDKRDFFYVLMMNSLDVQFYFIF